MQFSGKIGRIIGWHPPLWLVPPLGNPGSAAVLENQILLWLRDLTIFSHDSQSHPISGSATDANNTT